MRFVLVLHILGAATWFGANVAQAFLGASVGGASPEIRLWWSESGEKMSKIVYSVAAVVILATGIYLVVQDPGNLSFGSKFVSIGFAAVIIGAVLGMVVFGPKNRAIAAAIREGDADAEQKARSSIMLFGILDTLIVVLTIGVMVYKFGAVYKAG